MQQEFKGVPDLPRQNIGFSAYLQNVMLDTQSLLFFEMESKLLLNEQLVIYLIYPDLICYLSDFSHTKHDFTSQYFSKRT